jgi:hypothetical protein
MKDFEQHLIPAIWRVVFGGQVAQEEDDLTGERGLQEVQVRHGVKDKNVLSDRLVGHRNKRGWNRAPGYHVPLGRESVMVEAFPGN